MLAKVIKNVAYRALREIKTSDPKCSRFKEAEVLGILYAFPSNVRAKPTTTASNRILLILIRRQKTQL